MPKDKSSISLSKYSSSSFTLIELIIVIIIVGILAAVGISQYSLTVEKGRTAEAKNHLGTIRYLAYQYYMENGTFTGMGFGDVGIDGACHSTDFYSYSLGITPTAVNLYAHRCTSGGKIPNASRGYSIWMSYWPDTGVTRFGCWYTDDHTACFGMPSNTGL